MGKENSRRNGLKHGLTGRGVVVAEEDQAEVDARIESYTADMKPTSPAGAALIVRMAILSVREQRAARQELAATALRVRHAAEAFDEEQVDRADQLFYSLAENLRNNLRRLRKFPEGVDRLLQAWRDLRGDLGIVPVPNWTRDHLVRAANLLGLKAEHADGSPFAAPSRIVWGDVAGPGEAEGGHLDEKSRRDRALAGLLELIDAEIASLEAHYETLDFETIELDRAEAGERALFDSSKAASLARRYESEARREFSKALKDFRLVEAESLAKAPAAPTPSKAPQPPERSAELGSRRETLARPEREASRPFPDAPRHEFPTAQGPEGRPLRVDHPSRPPG